MEKSFKKILQGYLAFRKKYALGDRSIMQDLSHHGQKPEIMLIACCDSRVDPALILQCHPGDLFIVRNIANIIPPYESDEGHHSTSAALEYGVCYLKVKHLVILGHSQCGGIQAWLNSDKLEQDDFLTRWLSLLGTMPPTQHPDFAVKEALARSYTNSLTFPWIKERVEQYRLSIHLWYFDIKGGEIFNYSFDDKQYHPLMQSD